ncbi:hypothetical protein DAPPUDRAFT_100959 [Daphnia pulex]|uniref:Uncharacterized protein n=1 Tax=Daphnia pulex TaxID=6669 RepID=E9GBS7_DAPPU|nr:hypothetical protein DAPPUDRAFT_100959 [Daphnia pulex]|eukprot:EFX83010.1 hypothetical protein DAPPUDRAFT_100959 [Daphnia pulex]
MAASSHVECYWCVLKSTICYFPEITSGPHVSIYNALSSLKLCDLCTEILEPMLAFVHDRRVAFTNVLPHPHLRDVRSSSFAATCAATRAATLATTRATTRATQLFSTSMTS